MTVTEAWQRGNNLLATGILGLSGLAFLPELFLESEHAYKIDEAVLFLIGAFAVGWYLKGKNRFTHSIVPVILVWLAFATKVMGLVIEFKDKEDAGDDFGALILFLLASLLITWLYIQGKKLLAK